QAQISVYEQRGDYQLIIHNMELAGDGVLRNKFEELKKKLFKEGLFAAEGKQAIPRLPKCIGVVTSPTGAAIRDVISVLKRRFASIPIIIY
ncbi:MAG: exodeoxyribonuclease VII large subunit, partial [Hydrotalea flava]|nr:exodeoxyribonuclease VII large subunit [Hydrotalea flava]NIT19367.1 exodeoxyribonuclease VII large subunit [Hydrotalea flava]